MVWLCVISCPYANLPFKVQTQHLYVQDLTLNSLPISALTEHPGDVGGQKTLRSYWRNYFEKTDALIWVVDATDRLRIQDCREELHGLLQEEVSYRRRLRNEPRS